MRITHEPFDDRSEPDANGMYDYIYLGANYSFQEGDQQLTFRLYRNEPGIANLVFPIEWSPNAYTSELFSQAVEYLRTNETVRMIKICDPTPPGRGFIPINEAIELAGAAGLSVPIDFNS